MIMVNLIPLPREINLSKGEFVMPKMRQFILRSSLSLLKVTAVRTHLSEFIRIVPSAGKNTV